MSLQPNDGVVLKRDVYVTIIPQGEPMPLPAGTLVRVIQNLGGSYTIDVNGNWFLVHEDDHDCLGVARDPDLDTYLNADGSLADRVWLALRQCYDPEIPVNIVELGLVYHVDCYQQDQEQHVLVTMTLTSPGCGMGPVMIETAKRKILRMPEVGQVHMDLVFDPPWDKEMMSDAAKLQLGVL